MTIPKDFRICFPDKKIYISADHNWAFAAWELHKRAGKIKPNATLIHVDAHLDDIWDGLEVEGLRDIEKYEDVFDVAGKMKIENFIWPAVGTGTIDKVIYVSQYSHIEDPFDFKDWNLFHPDMRPVKEILDRGKYIGLRYWNLEEFLVKKDSQDVKVLTEKPDLILDLDLDYFAEEDIDTATVSLMDEQKIIDNLTSLKDLYPWSLITVSLSPFFCGGDDNTLYLFGLFSKVFGLKPKDALEW
jgi:hypothetical protein